jgi:outer membrane protein
MATTKISVQQLSEKLFKLVGRNYLFTDKTNVTFDATENTITRSMLLNADNVVPTWEEVERAAIVFIVDSTKNTIKATAKITAKDSTADNVKVLVDNTSTEVNAKLKELEENIKTNKTNIETNAANITTNANDIDALEGRMDTAEADILANAGNITQNAADIDALEARMATAEGNITTNTNNIATNASNIATNVLNITTNTNDIKALKEKTATEEAELDALTERVTKNETDIAERVTKTEAATFVKDIAYDATTCKFTFTMYDDSTEEVDLPLESTVKGGRYDADTNTLILILNDEAGTEIEIPVEDLVDIYTGSENDQIKVEVSADYIVSAALKTGSIDETFFTTALQERLNALEAKDVDLQEQIDAIDPSVAAKITGIELTPDGQKTTFDVGFELAETDIVDLYYNGLRELEGKGYTVDRTAGSNGSVTTLFDVPAEVGDTLYIEVTR